MASTALPDALATRRAARYRRLVWLVLFLTFDLIVFGAFVRLSDAGLGCPDWPGCFGKVTPLHAHADILAAQAAAPTGPVTPFKAWIEMIHRYVASLLGLLILTLAVLGWRWRRALRVSPAWGTLLFVWICLQGAFGALTVTARLMPLIVTSHLLGGVLLLAGLAALAGRLDADPTPAVLTKRDWYWGAAALAAVLLQIALGGWVSSNYAVLACTEFPSCQGRWLPPMDFAAGFSLWRPLGMLPDGSLLPQAALTAIHWVHRNVAFVVLLILGGWALRLGALPRQRRLAQLILIVLVVQILTGLGNVLLQWPLLLAIAHSAGAASLIGMTTFVLSRTLSRSPLIQSSAR